MYSTHNLQPRLFDKASASRTSEVARCANDIQRQTGATRTEALKAAEKLIPKV